MKYYGELVKSLDQLVTVYRHLLDCVRRENETLLQADVAQVPEINIAKEKLIIKVRDLDKVWQQSAKRISIKLGMKSSEPTLLELAGQFSGEDAKKLERIHSVLNIIVNRVDELNKQNKVLVQSILSHISGAMSSITRTLNENPTYRNSGSMEQVNQDAQGRLVQREA